VKFAWLLLLLSLPLAAQTGTVAGTLRDPDGNAIPKASVQLRNTATGAVVQATSFAGGQFQLDVPEGTYDLTVPFPCCQHATYSYSGINVRAGGKTVLNIPIAWHPKRGTAAPDAGAAAQ